MSIIEALKDYDLDVVIKNGDKIMYWDAIYEQWVVRKSQKRKGYTKIICETSIEEYAIKELLNG